VSGNENNSAFDPQLGHPVAHEGSHPNVERFQWLIEDDDLWLTDQSCRQHCATALSH
jgi:hypothetical protein